MKLHRILLPVRDIDVASEFYATAFGLTLNKEVWTALTFLLGLTFRLLAIRFKWEMPKFVFDSGER